MTRGLLHSVTMDRIDIPFERPMFSQWMGWEIPVGSNWCPRKRHWRLLYRVRPELITVNVNYSNITGVPFFNAVLLWILVKISAWTTPALNWNIKLRFRGRDRFRVRFIVNGKVKVKLYLGLWRGFLYQYNNNNNNNVTLISTIINGIFCVEIKTYKQPVLNVLNLSRNCVANPEIILKNVFPAW